MEVSMKIAKYLLVVVDSIVDYIETYALYDLSELDQFDLSQRERDRLLLTSQTSSKGRLFKIIIVDINIGRKGDEKA